MEVQNRLSPDHIKELQSNLQIKIKRCKKIIEQKRKLRATLQKMKDTDEWALCGLYTHHYIHKNDPKYQDIENDKCNLEESCENAKLAIAQLLHEENELSEHLKQLQTKLGHFFGMEQEQDEHDCCCAL